MEMVAKTPRVRAEATPEAKPMVKAGGKAIGILKKKGLKEAQFDKPTWKPFKLYVTATPDLATLPRPLLLVTWSESTGYHLNEEALKAALPSADYDGVLEALRRERRH